METIKYMKGVNYVVQAQINIQRNREVGHQRQSWGRMALEIPEKL